MDLSSDHVSKTLAGTELYTVSNSDNEFVLISDPNGLKSIGLLCFRKEDADVFLAQVRLRKGELRGRAKVVPIALDQVIAYLQVSTIKRIVGKRLLPRNCLQTVYRLVMMRGGNLLFSGLHRFLTVEFRVSLPRTSTPVIQRFTVHLP